MTEAARVPRKVIVGSCIFDTYRDPFPGIHERIIEISDLLDKATVLAKEKFGRRSPDLFILPEDILGSKYSTDPDASFYHPDGPELLKLAELAAAHTLYLVVPFYSCHGSTIRYNSAALINRQGEIQGFYHKNHPVFAGISAGLARGFEQGVIKGTESPVFSCDFGRLGIQICFDMNFESGWRALAAGGAEIVAWPSESPQTILSAYRAFHNGYYIISSTTRLNATVFDPAGGIFDQIMEPDSILVQELDLSYEVLNWSAPLSDGKLLSARYGDRVGYRYYKGEDRGIFWSNDPLVPIDKMIQESGLESYHSFINRLASSLGDKIPLETIRETGL
jgi:predicted amidohydrolase